MALNSKAAEAKYNVAIDIDGSVGVIATSTSENIPCHVETQLRVEVTGVGPLNEIQIYGRIRSSTMWHYIATVTGSVTGIADISTYDFIRYLHATADGTGKLVASGFIFNTSSGGSGGSATAVNQVTGNNLLQNIDAKTQGSLLSNVQFDDIHVTYPTSNTELYEYYLLTALVASIEVTYVDSTKRVLTRVRKI